MAPDPSSGSYEPHGPTVCVTRGTAHGLAFALPWAIVLWLAIACAVMVAI